MFKAIIDFFKWAKQEFVEYVEWRRNTVPLYLSGLPREDILRIKMAMWGVALPRDGKEEVVITHMRKGKDGEYHPVVEGD